MINGSCVELVEGPLVALDVGIGSVGPSEVQRYGLDGSGISHLSQFHSAVLSYFNYGCWEFGLRF